MHAAGFMLACQPALIAFAVGRNMQLQGEGKRTATKRCQLLLQAAAVHSQWGKVWEALLSKKTGFPEKIP